MKLQTQITQTKEPKIEVRINGELSELPCPCFFKNDTGQRYLAVLDKKTVVKFFYGEKYINVENSSPENLVFPDDLKRWEPIDESEFFRLYDDVYEHLSLRPKLNESFVDMLNTLELKSNGNNDTGAIR